MSDDISIPRTMARPSFTHSYRTRRTGGMDPGTKQLTIAAGGLGLLLALGMGAWSTIGHRGGGGVPVIEADSRPLRVKPDNPGGMTVIGANEQIMSGAAGDGTSDMAPAAERPDPQALRAQMQLGTAPQVTVPATPAAASGKDAAAPVEAAVARPVPQAAAPTAAAPAVVSRAAAPAAASGALVQVAAVDSEAGAGAEWARLQRKMPDLLGDRRAVIQHVERDGKAIWRVRTGGFADISEATSFCAKVRAKGGGCSLASF